MYHQFSAVGDDFTMKSVIRIPYLIKVAIQIAQDQCNFFPLMCAALCTQYKEFWSKFLFQTIVIYLVVLVAHIWPLWSRRATFVTFTDTFTLKILCCEVEYQQLFSLGLKKKKKHDFDFRPIGLRFVHWKHQHASQG